MLGAKTTLVLGAGASAPYGYPLGNQLRLDLIALGKPDNHARLLQEGLFRNELLDFIREFQRSQTGSIDAFLARRPEFSEVGKRAIATVLLKCEDEGAFLERELESHWYRYLLNKFTAASWEELDFSTLSIVTFNYDRSLEHYLLFALQHAYGKSQEEVLDKLSTLSIVHVYGSLGPTLPIDASYMMYARGRTLDRVNASAATLRVIPEGRDTDPTIQHARAMLGDADAIAFLGFGFDDANLARLDFARSCKRVARRVNGTTIRRVVGSCMGMTCAEVNKVARQVASGSEMFSTRQLPEDFFDGDCLGALRESLILG